MITEKKHRSGLFGRHLNYKLLVIGISIGAVGFINSGTTVRADLTPSVVDEQKNSTVQESNLEIPKDVLYSGNYGEQGVTDIQWYISSDKVLHLCSGNIQNSTGSKTSPWSKYSDDITKVSFDGTVVLPRYVEYLFANLKNVTEFDNLNNLSMPDTEDWTGTFSGDTSLKEMDFPKWDGSITRAFSEFSHMFENDTSLTSVDISGWDVDNVTTMENMFAGDTALEKVGVKFFEQAPFADIASLSNVKNMFENDSSLKTLDLSNWGMWTKRDLMDTTTMFKGTNLQSIKLSTLNQFTAGTALPAKNASRWLNIGNGTAQDPQGDKSFSTASIADYYDGSNIIRYPYSDVEKDKFKIDTFVPDKHVMGDLVIKSNLSDQTVHSVTGNIGDIVKVKVPLIKGYTSDKDYVSAKINDDGSITTTDKVFYKKDQTNHSSSSSHSTAPSQNHNNNDSNINSNVQMMYRKLTVMTYSDKPFARLYMWDSGSAMKLVTNRALQKDSGWLSDEQLNINGKYYYRVATNEWVKAEDVYVYQSHSVDVETKPGNVKDLYKAEGNRIENRALAQQSKWYSDITANINDQKYYRVGTNEFVKASDVTEY